MKFNTSRFHMQYGPKSLFDRVLFVMSNTNKLQLNSKHFKYRFNDRKIPEEVLKQLRNFNINQWKLVTPEVRNDKGKFINSTWEKVINKTKYWITIGFNDVVQTIIVKDTVGTGKVIKAGEIYDFTEKVNKKLMLESSN